MVKVDRMLVWVMIAVLGLPLGTTSSWAAMKAGSDTDNADATSIAASDIDCDTFCKDILDAAEAVTDKECANHGLPTNGNVHKDDDVTLTTDSSCAVDYIKESETCDQASQIRKGCLYKNSQIAAHCESYQAATDAGTLDWVLWGMDVATAGTCAIACYAGSTNPSLVTACSYAGIATGAAELASVLTQESSTVGKMVGSIAAVAGAGTSAYSLMGSCSGPDKTDATNANNATPPLVENPGGQTPGAGPQTAPETPVKPVEPPKTEGRAWDAGQTFAFMGLLNEMECMQKTNFEHSPAYAAKSCKEKMACTAAVAFAIYAGIRTAAIIEQNDTKKDACNNVKSLMSEVVVSSPSARPSPTSSSASLSATGASTASVAAVQSANNDAANNGIASISSSALRSKDAAALAKSGLDRMGAKRAKNLDIGKFKNALASGASAGSMMRTASRSMGIAPNALANGLAQLADMTAADAKRLGPALGVHTSLAASGAKAKKEGGENIGELPIINGQDPNAGMGAGGTQYGTPQQPEDIYHSRSGKSIFQIISEKIRSVANRIRGN